ncbi:DNA methyltransferase [Marinobacter gelidimuriae]|jgi:site-specific DNA-methyltransferase (cytosine-N4-specific)|uniref:DNA methyltransferase n=1 Tax=Marinobacter gelidimuriae TaxID=2739064 RepID=UPI00039C5A35
MTREGDLVVDPFADSLTTAVASEKLGRSWLVTECMWKYVMGGSTRFAEDSRAGLRLSPDFLRAVA